MNETEIERKGYFHAEKKRQREKSVLYTSILLRLGKVRKRGTMTSFAVAPTLV